MRRFVLMLLLAAVALLGYYRWHMRQPPGRAESFTPATAPRVDPKDVQTLASLDAEYTNLVKSVVPAVVSVTTSRRVKVAVVDQLDYLFGYRGRTAEQTQPAGIGSGVIISAEGHVLTNHHVIAGSNEIEVQLTDGRSLPATLIGSDPNVDIAVLRINPEGTVALPLGDSDAVRVGQNVIAVGNPFGLQETVTRGIISAKGRALRDSGVEFFQTDAAVNPGNSGGPLINLRGEVVGINSAIYSQTGSFAGISFAIPANVARRTLEAILQTGRPVRGYLGAQTMPLNQFLARELGLRDLRGALVISVVSGSPADLSGLRQGDLIRTLNGRVIDNPETYSSIISSTPIGSRVELVILREGEQITLSTQIAEMPEQMAKPQAERAPTTRDERPRQR